MSKRKKSNDNIPEDEMLLSEAIAAAENKHMAFCTGAKFRDSRGLGTYNAKYATACCALGALELAQCKHDLASSAVVYGNDSSCKFWDDLPEEQGESLGYAFRFAMTQNE